MSEPDPQADRMGQDFQRLAEYRDSAAPGWTREAFTEADTEARHFVAGLMRAAGLQTTIDAVGNVIGELTGDDPTAGLLVTGSHTDTVHGGGRFDGVVGVLGAIECVRVLRETGTRLRHTLRVVDFSNEEPNAHALSCVGSRAIAGNLDRQMLGLTDLEGLPLAERLRRAGWDPAEVPGCQWRVRDVDAYVELHIEQGPVLEQAGAPVGVVTSIAGIGRFVAEFFGRRDHAGTMPMDQRHDATCCAANAILAVERIAAAGADTVGTIGEILTRPSAVNVTAEFASISGEFRSPDEAALRAILAELGVAIHADSQARGTEFRLDLMPMEPPVVMDDGISQVLADAAAAAGHDSMRLYSGAGHDTVQMARLAPSGMIFVPSVDGRSHCPEEFTSLADCAHGVDVLMRGLVALDGR